MSLPESLRVLARRRQSAETRFMTITRVHHAAITAAAVFAAMLAISGALRAVVPEPVKTDAGLLSGAPAAAPGVRVFKGIPFAAPPVGELRWRPPQPAAHWTGIRKADTFGHVCVQPKGVGRVNVSVDLPDSPAASEDCLYLNVWTAARSASERRPVMVWIFGGGLIIGSPAVPATDGAAFAKKGVVLVSINYRLGAFGFLAHPELTKESAHHSSGNYGLL